MPQQTKIFRVFISSTFADMREERSILQQEVFPKLEKLCETKGARFQAVDLRWGVNEESQLDQKTMDICLGEIKRCQHLSPKPNFIALLGDRYGWQPIPAKIPLDEMLAILSRLASDDKALIELWYKLDENAIPAEYVLQPRGIEHKDYQAWEQVEIKIRNILREAVAKLEFTALQKVKYFASATHQEIINGALNPPSYINNPEEHVFAYIRKINDLPDNQTAKDFIDMDGEKQDSYSKEQLVLLKHELKEKLKANYFEYEADWKGTASAICNRGVFGEKVYQDLLTIVENQLEDIVNIGDIENEVRLHEEFKTKLTEHFCGREDIIADIKKYLSDSADNKVLSIIGQSGSGKSSVMAKALSLAETEIPNAAIIYRFIGTSSRSSNILSFLLSICGQIAKDFGVTLESLASQEHEKKLYEIYGLTEILAKCLALGTPAKPVMLFLDALDQFSNNEGSSSFYWLPRELPAHAKIIVSALPELEGHLSETIKMTLPVLPETDARQILEKWFQSAHRMLTGEQLNEVLTKFNFSGLSIYLKLAFERAKYWHSYDVKMHLQPDVKGIINDFFQHLEKEHTERLVRNVTCYMLCGRYQGLTENEILEILFFDKEFKEAFLKTSHEAHRKEIENSTKIPIVVWSRLYLDLEPFLTERDADGVPIITFFHRQFNEVLMERYGLLVKEPDRLA